MNVAFAAMTPTIEWVEVASTGEVTRMSGPMDSLLLEATLSGPPKQVRSPWDATVYIGAGTRGSNNWTATSLLRQSLTPGQSVIGSMLIFGPADDDGNVTPLDEDLYDAVMASVHQVRGTKP